MCFETAIQIILKVSKLVKPFRTATIRTDFSNHPYFKEFSAQNGIVKEDLSFDCPKKLSSFVI